MLAATTPRNQSYYDKQIFEMQSKSLCYSINFFGYSREDVHTPIRITQSNTFIASLYGAPGALEYMKKLKESSKEELFVLGIHYYSRNDVQPIMTGTCENDEKPINGVIREIAEEFHLTVPKDKVCSQYVTTDKSHSWTLYSADISHCDILLESKSKKKLSSKNYTYQSHVQKVACILYGTKEQMDHKLWAYSLMRFKHQQDDIDGVVMIPIDTAIEVAKEQQAIRTKAQQAVRKKNNKL